MPVTGYKYHHAQQRVSQAVYADSAYVVDCADVCKQHKSSSKIIDFSLDEPRMFADKCCKDQWS